MVASATLALKVGLWFRRVRLIMIPPRSRQKCRLRAEILLIPPVQISQATSQRYFLLLQLNVKFERKFRLLSLGGRYKDFSHGIGEFDSYGEPVIKQACIVIKFSQAHYIR